MAAKVKINHRGVEDVLRSPGVESDLIDRAERVAAAAESSAPVRSGDYKDSIVAFTEMHQDRVVAHVSVGVRYGMLVEANTGNLARALDAAAG